MEINFTNITEFRPRYSETDQMGVVYYGNYASYFEVGRVELLRDIGMTYAEMEASGTMLPVVHMSIDFKRGAKSMSGSFWRPNLLTCQHERYHFTIICETPQATH